MEHKHKYVILNSASSQIPINMLHG